MEKQHTNPLPHSGEAPSAEGSTVPTAKPQGKDPEVKEGNPSQQRPEYGANAGPNTSSREDQLPSLDNGSDLDSN